MGFETTLELQNYFNQKVLQILQKHEKKMIGWDEILEGGLAKSAGPGAATGDFKIWKVVNPISIDVGADILHQDYGITGDGVTVAVLDSGVYFPKKIVDHYGSAVANMFKGQADFVGDGLCTNGGK